MLFFIIKWFILYLLLIIITHNLYLFFEKNLTSTKTKDFIGFSNKEYSKITKILLSNNKNNIENNIENNLQSNNLQSNNLNNNFDINSFNSIFEDNKNINYFNNNKDNNNLKSMSGELDEFLNKLNSK